MSDRLAGTVGGPCSAVLLRDLSDRHESLGPTCESADIGIAEIDPAGNFLRVNAHLCGLMGRSPGDLLGRSIFDQAHPEDVERDRELFRRQVAGEIDRYGMEMRLRRADGGHVWVSVASSSLRDGHGRLLYAVRVLQDVTGRREAQESLARRMREQAALYELTERLGHATSLSEVYEPAQDAIMKALGCDRVSILLFDPSGAMRFVASRGLSAEYRRAVDGHSPWRQDDRAAAPICIGDVEASDLPPSLKETVMAEGIRALAFVPLQEGDRLAGKFMVYYDRAHAFSEMEIDLALTVARQIGFGITRIRAQQALRESEVRKSAILQSALDGIIAMDGEGRITDINPAAERILGYRRQEALGKAMGELMAPGRLRHEDRGSPWTLLEALGDPVVGRRIELTAVRRDGSAFEAELAVSRSRLDNGEVLFTAYLRDLTEAKRAERSAAQLASIVESSDDAIVSKDLDGIIKTWNGGAERLFGYAAEEVIGKSITILIPPDRIEEEPRILARIRRGERVDHYETVRRKKDGSLVDISLTVSPMKDRQGRIIGASKIARDITERKIAEAKLRESERHLKELLAAIPAAIYTTDAAGKITYFNQAAVELAGRTPTLGSDEWCVTWKLYRPDGTPLPHDQCPMALALREGRPVRNAEAVAERPDGTRVPFIPYPTPLRDEAGRIVGAINMLVDVSERKQAETQQRVLLDELNHRVKNNLQMLQSLLFTAARRARSPEAQEVLNEATSRIAAVAAAQRVLYAIKDATRFSAQEFMGSVCQTARQTFPSHVSIACEADPVELPNDAAMPLALILNELLTNAVKHGARGGAARVIRAGLKRGVDSFTLYVEDDGPGFDPEEVRGRSSGLQLVQGLARQLRGRFQVTTEPITRCSVVFS